MSFPSAFMRQVYTTVQHISGFHIDPQRGTMNCSYEGVRHDYHASFECGIGPTNAGGIVIIDWKDPGT